MKLEGKSLIMILVATLFVGCAKKDASPVQDEKYHLNILYGTIENYTGNDGQWLNIYQAESNEPTPVYIWAHGNGHTYMDAHEKYEPFITTLLENGISVISWESIKQMDESNFMDILDDADLMFQWVKANAATYNLDMTKIILGGHSRGTIASWRLAHRGDVGIKGIFHGDAAGNLDDVNDSLGNLITADAPPIRMSYTQNKVTNDGQHDPNEGQKIIDIYRSLGFSEEDSRLLENQGYPSMTELGFYNDLLSFCLYVLD
jgi:acetyl esterase/lipase